jgi:hypothetical protein
LPGWHRADTERAASEVRRRLREQVPDVFGVEAITHRLAEMADEPTQAADQAMSSKHALSLSNTGRARPPTVRSRR